MSYAGEGLTLRVIRNTKECGGLEQLKPIDQNLQYDFNFQQFVVLPEKVTLYPVIIIFYNMFLSVCLSVCLSLSLSLSLSVSLYLPSYNS